jgi:hypothetical protein
MTEQVLVWCGYCGTSFHSLKFGPYPFPYGCETRAYLRRHWAWYCTEVPTEITSAIYKIIDSQR